ncbi:MAG: efflux RND transporter periplasmic adaptor subunit [Alphaproteobacteria bacterium]
MADQSDVEKSLGIGRPERGTAFGRLPLAIVVLAVLGTVAALVLWPDPPVEYETETIARGDLVVFVTATGNLRPTVSIDVGAEVSGLIEAVLVDFNDPVKAGQVLARLDTEQLEAQVTQSQAALDQAEAAVIEAEATLVEARLERDRLVSLNRRDNASIQQVDRAIASFRRAEAGVTRAQAQVDSARAQLRLNQSGLEKAEIRSPIDGIVLDRLIEPGQTVASSFQTPHLFTIAGDLAVMELEVDIDEADIGQVQAGQQADFRVDAYTGRTFRGEIVSVRNAPKETNGVVTYEAVLAVENPDLALKPGMTATADIVVQTVRRALLVPNAALRFTPPILREAILKADAGLMRGERAVRVWVPGTAGALPEALLVETGPSDGRHTVLMDGKLSEGDTVLVDVKRPSEGTGR